MKYYTTTIVLLFLLCLTPALGLSQTTVNSGAISGKIVDENGGRVVGATLRCSKLTEYTRDRDGRRVVKQLGFQRTVAVGPDGSFALSELPAGRYSLCAYGSQPRQVSGCEWEGVPVVELAVGQNLQNITRKVLNGTLVTFRVADPQGRIASPDSYGNIASKRHFFIGVAAGTYYKPANPVSALAKQRVFQLTIPKQQRVRIFIDTDLNVTDPAGVALETKRQTSAQIAPAGQETVTIDLLVN